MANINVGSNTTYNETDYMNMYMEMLKNREGGKGYEGYNKTGEDSADSEEGSEQTDGEEKKGDESEQGEEKTEDAASEEAADEEDAIPDELWAIL